MISRLRRRGSGVLVPLASLVPSANFSFEFDRLGVPGVDPPLDSSPEALILMSFSFLKGFLRNDMFAVSGGTDFGAVVCAIYSRPGNPTLFICTHLDCTGLIKRMRGTELGCTSFSAKAGWLGEWAMR